MKKEAKEPSISPKEVNAVVKNFSFSQKVLKISPQTKVNFLFSSQNTTQYNSLYSHRQ